MKILKKKKDSRAGIDAKAHDGYARKQLIIDEYLIIVSDCSENTLKGTLKCSKLRAIIHISTLIH